MSLVSIVGNLLIRREEPLILGEPVTLIEADKFTTELGSAELALAIRRLG